MFKNQEVVCLTKTQLMNVRNAKYFVMYRHHRNFRNEKKLELAVNINSGATLSRHLYLISPENLKDPWRMANGK